MTPDLICAILDLLDFAGQDVYPSLEEKAANLLYFVTKNHSFSMEINVLRQLCFCVSWTKMVCLVY